MAGAQGIAQIMAMMSFGTTVMEAFARCETANASFT